MNLVSLGNCCVFDRSKQLDAASIQELVEPTGDIRLLPSSKDFDWKTTRERAGSLVCHGPIITMGKARYANIKYCEGEYVSSNNMLIKPRDKSVLDCRYLFHFLKQYSPKAYVEGTTYPKFDLHRFNEITIPLPPLDHQKTIASFFDLIEEQINGAKAQISLLDEQIKSLFNEMFFQDKSIHWAPMKEGLVKIGGGKSIVCKDHSRLQNNKAMLKLGAVSFGNYDWRQNKELIDESDFVTSAEVRPGDLLMVRKNTKELVGAAAFVFDTPSGLMLPDLIFRIIPNKKLNPLFLWTLFNHPAFRDKLTSLATGAAASMVNISKEKLYSLHIPFPSWTSQAVFAERLNQIIKLRFISQFFAL